MNAYVQVSEVRSNFSRLIDAAVAFIASVVNLSTVILLSVLRRVRRKVRCQYGRVVSVSIIKFVVVSVGSCVEVARVFFVL